MVVKGKALLSSKSWLRVRPPEVKKFPFLLVGFAKNGMSDEK
jgi:hypothetical protein